MTDIVSSKTRSRMMSGIRGKNTRPEMLIRKALFARGFRYRLHDKKLPGKPDLVLPKYRATLFVHGCFWHGHDCHLFKVPQTRTDFWMEKINSNRQRDEVVINELQQSQWRILLIWECATKGKQALPIADIVERIEEWLLSDNGLSEIAWDGIRTLPVAQN